MSEVVIIPHGLIGFCGTETGLGLALRDKGDEILFASKETQPLRWVKISEFTADPKGILSAEEAEAEEHEAEDDLD